MYEDWLSKAKASKSTGQSERTIERMVARGEIRQAYRRVPGRRPLAVLNPEDVERLKAQTVQPVMSEYGATPVVTTEDRQIAPVGITPRQGLAELLTAILERQRPAYFPRYLDIPTAAEYVGLPERYLRRMVGEGKLPALKTGRGWRVRRDHLDAM
jgi:excisionase family DNA binding protein